MRTLFALALACTLTGMTPAAQVGNQPGSGFHTILSSGMRYVQNYEQQFALLISEEHYVQELQRPPNPGDNVTVTLTYTGEVRDGVVDRVGRPDNPDDFIGLPDAAFADDTADVLAVVRTVPGLPPAFAGDPADVTVRRDF